MIKITRQEVIDGWESDANRKQVQETYDEYAKTQATAFTKWYLNSKWNGFCTSKEDLNNRKTIPEIYDIFQSQNKDK